MNNIETFDFEEHPVRLVEMDGDPWFVAADVARVLDIQNIRQNLKELDDDETGVCNVYTPGGQQEMRIINESGLYNLIFRSRKPEAKKFRKWVTAEVLPSIRKTGRYEMPSVEARDETDVLPDRSMSQWLKMIRETRLLYGRNAAREMWARSPLPDIREVVVSAQDTTHSDGLECLNLLLTSVFDGEPVLHYVNAENNQALMRCGLKVVHIEEGDFLAIANSHPFMDKVFRQTKFSHGRYVSVLKGLEGAKRQTSALRFTGYRKRCVFVPLNLAKKQEEKNNCKNAI